MPKFKSELMCSLKIIKIHKPAKNVIEYVNKVTRIILNPLNVSDIVLMCGVT